MGMDRKALGAVIESGRLEIADIDKRLAAVEPLRHRRDQLEALIQQAEALLGDGRENGEVEGTGAKPSWSIAGVTAQKQAIWEGARRVLLEAKRPMGAPAIAEALRKLGFRLTRNGAEVVRAAMWRRKDVFERMGGGLYALKEWPEGIKKVA